MADTLKEMTKELINKEKDKYPLTMMGYPSPADEIAAAAKILHILLRLEKAKMRIVFIR